MNHIQATGAVKAATEVPSDINWKVVGVLIEAHMTASRYHTAGTSNWGAALYKALRREFPAVGASVQPVPDGCAHDWKDFYTGPSHTHDICAKCEVKRPVQLVLASLSDECKLFEDWIVREAGPGAIEKWLGTEGYENARVQDYRTGWVACLDALASSTPSKGGETS